MNVYRRNRIKIPGAIHHRLVGHGVGHFKRTAIDLIDSNERIIASGNSGPVYPVFVNSMSHTVGFRPDQIDYRIAVGSLQTVGWVRGLIGISEPAFIPFRLIGDTVSISVVSGDRYPGGNGCIYQGAAGDVARIEHVVKGVSSGIPVIHPVSGQIGFLVGRPGNHQIGTTYLRSDAGGGSQGGREVCRRQVGNKRHITHQGIVNPVFYLALDFSEDGCSPPVAGRINVFGSGRFVDYLHGGTVDKSVVTKYRIGPHGNGPLGRGQGGHLGVACNDVAADLQGAPDQSSRSAGRRSRPVLDHGVFGQSPPTPGIQTALPRAAVVAANDVSRNLAGGTVGRQAAGILGLVVHHHVASYRHLRTETAGHHPCLTAVGDDVTA